MDERLYTKILRKNNKKKKNELNSKNSHSINGVFPPHIPTIAKREKVWFPLLQAMDNCKKFLIVNLLVELTWMQLLWFEGHQMRVGQRGRELRNDSCNHIVTRIFFENGLSKGVEVRKYGSSSEHCFEKVEFALCLFSHNKRSIFSKKRGQVYNGFWVIFYKFAIKVRKTQKPLESLNTQRFRPVIYLLELSRIHGKTLSGKNKTWKLERRKMKFAFGKFSVKSMLLKPFEHLSNM